MQLQRGDQILAELGNGADAVSAAMGIVAAEKNFNNFTASQPTICSDPALPSSAVLRGITPLIDPGVQGADVANQLAAQTKATPLTNTDGMSVADLLKANGFTNFMAQASAGPLTTGNVGGAQGQASSNNGGAAAASSGSSSSSSSSNSTAGASSSGSSSSSSSSSASNSTAGASTGGASAGTNANGVQQSSIAGLDFGTCVPTIKFEGGLGGRPPTEFTFQLIDPVAAKGQQEALNPNIITNRVCDQLTNVCAANAAAKTACGQAKTAIMNLGTRDKSTADAWNSMLGFAGTVTNPDGGPASPAASASAAARAVRAFVA